MNMSRPSVFYIKKILLIPLILLISACTSPASRQLDVIGSTRELVKTASVNAGNEEYIRLLRESRTWVPHDQLSEDPIELGINAKIPIQHEGVKILGPSEDDALRSLALKVWLIENAQHTVDVVYYIFKPDLAGEAILGALCNAVKRGVDVRMMVDSIGSMSPFHTDLLALATCADQAGYMRTVDGQKTVYKARIQAAIFNALTRSTSMINRRSHDKVLVIDGAFPTKAAVMTGGRNISLAYYGIKADGSVDHNVYRDLEVLLRPGPLDTFAETTVGDTSTMYYTLLFLHNGNRLLQPVYQSYEYDIVQTDPYQRVREKAQQSLAHLKNLPQINKRMNDMAEYMNSGFQEAKVALGHELANLTNTDVVTNAIENKEDNPNSIRVLFKKFVKEGPIKIVSPYLFIPRYVGDDGEINSDGVTAALQWLDENPDNRIGIITNSVLTSDNFLAQSVIDMDLGPRLLLTPELRKAWVSSLEEGELNPDIVDSEQWKKLINNPQIFIYEMGRLDAAALGNGETHYGKLHAKFIMGEDTSFVGTSNLDYRSRLYNNEMGFFITNESVQQELNDVFDELKASSYRWGTPEWLQMRKEVMALGGLKGWSTSHQRFIYNFLMATGLIWYI